MRLETTADGFATFDGRVLPLAPLERGTLGLLIEVWPDPVSKEQFSEQVWCDADMSDESLARCISGIRRSLPPAAEVQVRSVYGYGYRLVTRQQANAALHRQGFHQRIGDVASGAVPWAEAVLHCRSALDRRDLADVARGADILRSVIAESPAYAPARLLLTEFLAYRAVWGPCGAAEQIAEAHFHLDHVARQRPDMPGLLGLRAHLLDIQWHFAQAADHFARAHVSSPDDPATHYLYSHHLLATGDMRGAVAAARRASALNPWSATIAMTLSRALYAAGDAQDAIDVAERARPGVGRDMALMSMIEAQLDYITGTARADSGAVHQACSDDYAFKQAHIAYHGALSGDHGTAFAAVERSLHGTPAERAATIPTLLKLDRIDDAMRQAESACADRVAFLPIMLRKPEAAGLAKHPRYGDLLAHIHSMSADPSESRAAKRTCANGPSGFPRPEAQDLG